LPDLSAFSPGGKTDPELRASLSITETTTIKQNSVMSDSTTEVNDPANTTVDELKALIREAEEALGSSAEGDEIEELRERLRDAVANGQNLIANLTDTFKRQARRADDAIRSNPYQTIGIATGVGLIAGYLLSRRSSSGAD
jgi:ElaB/YqjD/DUF883 family membrane-anchored ribosome-binding protein